ncbi:thioredoxin [Defluviitalea raffinosedens]|uniref:thioredoxin n=1 Tax=Defluviitalea raffinosedens TaxID=1450156 RepID=UPI00176E7FD6|nr:thioredoxin [Defluviitalea raffinosedens]MBM7685012.1 thioredoxin 1 [Defluviitalea raffinosedens]HHW67523.1 thioredoxin [Candidatus Epulonipiscium sp.]
MAKQLTPQEFQSEVLDSKDLVLVDFFATWCGPCKMMAPVIDQLAEEMNGKVKIFKIDVDEARDLAAKYRIMSVPTLMFFKNGEVVDQIMGAVPKDRLVDKINALI